MPPAKSPRHDGAVALGGLAPLGRKWSRGRCVSVDHSVVNSVRPIPPSMVSDQAAGTAATLASARAVEPAELDIAALWKQLAAENVILQAEALNAVPVILRVYPSRPSSILLASGD